MKDLGFFIQNITNYEAKAYIQADENQLLLQSVSIQPELQEVNENGN